MALPLNPKLPVLNAAGVCVGEVVASAHKQAAALAGSESVRQEWRPVNGRLRLCFIPSKPRSA